MDTPGSDAKRERFYEPSGALCMALQHSVDGRYRGVLAVDLTERRHGVYARREEDIYSEAIGALR